MTTANRQPAPPSYRWQDFFQRAAEPLFLLSRDRRILFVNAAWEALTGLSAAQARGLLCTARARPEAEALAWLARLLAPPQEIARGDPAQARRRAAGPSVKGWWEVQFFPLRGEDGLLGVLGKIHPVPSESSAARDSLPPAALTAQHEMRQRFRWDSLAGEGPAFRRAVSQARLAAETRAPFLIVGEAGTGKHWLARVVHQQGTGADGPFAALYGALPTACLERALFDPAGLLRPGGAGCVYLREPAALPRDVQARLCDEIGAAQEAPAPRPRPRLMAGCRGDPEADVVEGRLAGELFHALGTLIIHLPPLRGRPEDLRALAERLLRMASERTGGRVSGLRPAAWEVLQAYSWPGNLREFFLVLASGCLAAKGDRIDVPDLPAYLGRAVARAQAPAAPVDRPLPLDRLLEETERRLIRLALSRCGGNKSRAADLLGVWRPRLLRRIEALGIQDPRDAEGGQAGGPRTPQAGAEPPEA